MPINRLALIGALAVMLATHSIARAEDVDMALVLAVDVSDSVDAAEYHLQQEGIARAFEDPALVAVIGAGRHGAIDVLMLEWSDTDKQTVTVDWTRLRDAASAHAFAAKIRATSRSSDGLTAIGSALLAAGAAFHRLPDHTERRVIDVSGDGMANVGPQPAAVRDALVSQGITINGLAILASEPWLETYYDQDVIGGTGAFLFQVKDFQSFAAAIKQKLLAEIAARSSTSGLAALQMQ
jgi:Protein of unknown function (DUF1194)